MNPMMGAPQPAFLGTAQNYSYPLTSGLLGAIGSHGGIGPWAQNAAGTNPAVAAQQAQMSQPPQDYSQLAMQLAGNPHAGPYSTAGNLVQPGAPANPAAGSTSGGSTASQIAGGLLGALAKNPSLIKDGASAVKGLLGDSSPSSLMSPAAADALGSYAAGLAPETASLISSAVAPTIAADSAALSGVGDSALAAQMASEGIGTGATTAGTAAGAGSGVSTAGLGATAGAATALGLAALPLALAAVVPYNSGFSGSEVQGMLNDISAATKANGGLLNAGSGISNGQVTNPQLANAFQDLTTLIGTNPAEFTKSGGTSPIDQQLTAMGYGGLLSGGTNSTPTTSPLKGSRSGWLGGGYSGAKLA